MLFYSSKKLFEKGYFEGASPLKILIPLLIVSEIRAFQTDSKGSYMHQLSHGPMPSRNKAMLAERTSSRLL
jgi:hypothetical protein